MIKELRLTNWKSFGEATLYIDPLTILIGANASGKSNVLDALLFLHRISKGMDIFRAINGDEFIPELRGGVEWACLKPRKEFSLELIVEGDKLNEDYRYHLSVKVDTASAEIQKEELFLRVWSDEDQVSETDMFTAEGKGTHLMMKWGKEVKESEYQGKPLPSFIGFHSNSTVLVQIEKMLPNNLKLPQVASYLLKLLRNILVFDPIPSHMRDYTKLSDRLFEDGANLAGVLAALKEPRKTEVEEALTRYLKALPERDIKKVWAETVGRSNSDAMLYCQEGWSEDTTHEIDARGMSDGTLRYLAIVAALLTREEGSLLVIEEVDNGLHPSRAGSLLEMLRTLGKERNIDVIVTTHNPALLDAAGIELLPYIAMAYRDNKTGVSRLKQLEDLKQLPKLLASGNLGKLSSEGRIQSAIKRETQE